MQLGQLIQVIQQTHEQTQQFAVQQVNNSLTLRNWLIGFYLVEYEQKGEDRADYGANLLAQVAGELKKCGIKGLNDRALRGCRSFYSCYPQIWRTVSAKLYSPENEADAIWRTVSAIFKALPENLQTVSAELQNEGEQPGTEAAKHSLPADMLLTRLSFSHFIELMKADKPLQRAFYEVQAVKNNWSVRELKRAMETLLFERSGLSTDKAAVIAKAKDEIPVLPGDVIRNPYVLEFLGLEQKPEFSESDLEQAIIDHLQKFLVEMGRGFCFEARQRRITFDNNHYYIDLVFYHRILKCHVLVDLKLGAFSHADAGQMNVYLNYYKDQEMTAGDNPPIGIILCAHKNDTLVKYATGGLSQEMFVGKYLVQLPSEDELKQLIEADTRAFQQIQEG